MDSRPPTSASQDLAPLFKSEIARLQRYLQGFGPRVSSEDIAQESFLKLCATDTAAIDSPRAYLFRTARNLAINALRRDKGAPVRFVADPESLGAAASAPSPEASASTAEAIRHLNAALATLDPRKRQALLLFRVEGWSYREIGDKLGVSHRTVERYVADAVLHCHLALTAHAREDTPTTAE